jgi:hypothetical protein
MNQQFKEISAMQLPSEYTSLGVETGYKPTPAEKLRMFLTGPAGGGKTTFANSIPRALILDYERGAGGTPMARAARVFVGDHNKHKAVMDALLKDASNPKRPFNAVIFDTVDQYLEVKNAELCEVYGCTDITTYGSKGHGYNLLKQAVWNDLRTLTGAGYAWICVGHLSEKTITVNKSDVTVVRPVVFGTLANCIIRNCDIYAMVQRITRTEQLYKEYQGRKIEAGTRQVEQVVLDATGVGESFGTTESKVRNIASFKQIVLPNPLSGQFGWDAFKQEYQRACDEAAAKEAELLKRAIPEPASPVSATG